MPLPELVIAGAPKCGTTSLFRWLAAHPGINASRVKETCYLMDRSSPLFNPDDNWHDKGEEGYQGLFPPGPGMAMEATPDYLYQDTALRVLADLPSRPLVICVLRRPSERVLSAFRFYAHRLTALEPGLEFPEFVDRLLSGRPVGHGPRAELAANALRYSRYADYCIPWAEALGQRRFRILLLDDLTSDPKTCLRRLCRDAGLDEAPIDGIDLRPSNTARAVRSLGLQRMRNLAVRVLPSGRYRRIVGAVYRAVNYHPGPPVTSNETLAILDALDEMFEPCTRTLAQAFGIDLKAWLPGAPRNLA